MTEHGIHRDVVPGPACVFAMTSMHVIIAIVFLGTVFWLGFLVGAEVQKVVLRGHEGTRADKLLELRRQREESVQRFRDRRYGPPHGDAPTF
jgi:hypothetical protein